jgi:hypothetical protein
VEADLIGYEDLTWDGDQLRLGRRTVATIEPDVQWPGMWRVRISSRPLSDMLTRTRAKDAARRLALSQLNASRETQRSSVVRFSERAAAAVMVST